MHATRFRSLLPLCMAVLWGCAQAQSAGVEFDLAPPDDLGGETAPDLRAATSPDLSRGGGADLSQQAADLSQPPSDLATIACQTVPQAGCPAGDKCTTHDTTTTTCDPVGTDSRGSTCKGLGGGVDSCVAGTVCIDESGGMGALSQCREFCKTDADCGVRGFCDYFLGMSMTFKLCTQPCNALPPATGAGSGCATGLSCFAYGQEHTDCLKAGAVPEYSPCTTDTDCMSGLACIGPMGGSVCRRICPKGNDGACAAGEACFNVMAGAGFTWPTYGVCCDNVFGC